MCTLCNSWAAKSPHRHCGCIRGSPTPTRHGPQFELRRHSPASLENCPDMELNSPMDSLNDDQDEDIRGFTFIHISHPDEIRQRSTQRAIRCRVMTEVGRLRRKRPLALTISINILPTASEAPENVPSGALLVESPANQPYWEHVPRSLHPSGLYPVEPDSRALQLIYFSKLPGS